MLRELMFKCAKTSDAGGTATRKDRVLLFLLFGVIIVDIFIHTKKWEDFYKQTDPLYYDFEYYE